MKKLEELNDVLTVKEVREFLGISRGKGWVEGNITKTLHLS